jgi:hypothetical protein
MNKQMKGTMMKRQEREEWAMFRYKVIAPLLHQDEGLLKKALNELSERIWTLPDGNLRKYSTSSIECWYYRYRQGGLDALKASPRKDGGIFRTLSPSVIEAIDALFEKHSRVKASTVIRMLRLQGTISGKNPSASTIYRYLRLRTKAAKDAAPSKERRAFEAPYSNNLWQVDILYGPKLTDRGKDGKHRKRQTYLVAIIDDHSRLLCHGEFYFEQNLLSYLDCLKKAVQKRGCFERMYCDNGNPNLNKIQTFSRQSHIVNDLQR